MDCKRPEDGENEGITKQKFSLALLLEVSTPKSPSFRLSFAEFMVDEPYPVTWH